MKLKSKIIALVIASIVIATLAFAFSFYSICAIDRMEGIFSSPTVIVGSYL